MILGRPAKGNRCLVCKALRKDAADCEQWSALVMYKPPGEVAICPTCTADILRRFQNSNPKQGELFT